MPEDEPPPQAIARTEERTRSIPARNGILSAHGQPPILETIRNELLFPPRAKKELLGARRARGKVAFNRRREDLGGKRNVEPDAFGGAVPAPGAARGRGGAGHRGNEGVIRGGRRLGAWGRRARRRGPGRGLFSLSAPTSPRGAATSSGPVWWCPLDGDALHEDPRDQPSPATFPGGVGLLDGLVLLSLGWKEKTGCDRAHAFPAFSSPIKVGPRPVRGTGGFGRWRRTGRFVQSDGSSATRLY